MKIYITVAHGGKYEDHWSSVDKAFYTRRAANEYVDRKEIEGKAWEEKAERILAEFQDKNLRTVDIDMALYDGYSNTIEEIELEE